MSLARGAVLVDRGDACEVVYGDDAWLGTAWLRVLCTGASRRLWPEDHAAQRAPSVRSVPGEHPVPDGGRAVSEPQEASRHQPDPEEDHR